MASEYFKKVRFKSHDKDTLLIRCVEAVILNGFKNILVNENRHEIKASTPISWHSWGETISIDLSNIDSLVEAEIRSHSKLITQVIDWGRNRRNVKRLISVLEKQGLLRTEP